MPLLRTRRSCIMLQILRTFTEDGYEITEYTRDGETVDTVTKAIISDELPEPTPIEPQPTVEEMQAQTLLNTEYLVSRSELGLGGN